MKNKVWETKNLVYEFKSRLHIAKDREIREALKKNIQCETKREKRRERRRRGTEYPISGKISVHHMRNWYPRRRPQEKNGTEIVKETMTENMPNIKPYF